MAVNAHGDPLCRHAKPGYQRRAGKYGDTCHRWCEWRIAVYTILVPMAVLIALLFTLVPLNDMFGFQ
jgi:hypothetical protein